MTELIKPNIENNSAGHLVSDYLKSQLESLRALITERAKQDPSFYPGGLLHVIQSHINALVHQIRSLGEHNVLVAYVNKDENATASEIRQDSGTVERTHRETEYVGLLIDKLLTSSREVTFEDGLGTEFYEELESIIKQYGKDAILALYYRIIESKHFDPEIAAETLNWLGTIDCPSQDIYRLRLWLLTESLKNSSPWVREGATIGLSRLNDPDAIPSLESAIQKEQRQLLRKQMNKAIARLKRTHDAAVSKVHKIEQD
jgi:hypothetical protein